jgi:hypothetical protein
LLLVRGWFHIQFGDVDLQRRAARLDAFAPRTSQADDVHQSSSLSNQKTPAAKATEVMDSIEG